MSDNSFIPNLIVLKNSSQSVLHYICTRDGIFERNKLYGCRKYKIADKKFSITSDTGVSVSLAPKAAIWGDMIFLLRISWTYLWRWEQCAFFSDGNKLSKVPVPSQQQMAVPLCIIVTNLSQNRCFKQTNKKNYGLTQRGIIPKKMRGWETIKVHKKHSYLSQTMQWGLWWSMRSTYSFV